MEDDAPMSLVEDRFDDLLLDDGPVEDNGSFYNEQDYVDCDEVEKVEPTSNNCKSDIRFQPFHPTNRNLATICEETPEEIRSNTHSRVATRPPSAMSDKSNDLSSQFGFQSGGKVIEKYTDEFFSNDNKGERLFPESGLIEKGFISPARDKQNSWEPSVCNYEKQPTPEILNNSPVSIFAGLNSRRDQSLLKSQNNLAASNKSKKLQEETNNENVPNIKLSPEKNYSTASPMNSTKFLEEKTSTPKRPGATNRLGNLCLPAFEVSTIYESPQRSSISPRVFQSRHLRNAMSPSYNAITNSDTMLSNQTINDSTVRKVISGNKLDCDLITALERARKKRELKLSKPDFRISSTQTRASSRLSAAPRYITSNEVCSASTSKDNVNSANASSTFSHIQASRQRSMGVRQNNLTSSDATNTDTNSISRLSTAKTDSYRSIRNRGGFSDSSVSTVIPSSSSSTTAINREQDGRDSVCSMRTISRAFSTVTVGGNGGAQKPLKICSKRLAFGAVPVGETLTTELEIENVSDRQCQVRCKLDSTTTIFQILDNKLTMVDPKKSMKLRISFTPSSIGRYQVLLNISVQSQNHVYKIPLWGLGGVANVVIVPAKDLQPTANPSEFTMCSSDVRRIFFKLSNSTGSRDAFALMKVYDSAMRPLPDKCVRFEPACGVIVKRKVDRRIELHIDTSSIDQREDSHIRTSSAMSNASVRRRASSAADYIVQVAWGEEALRQRLRLLEAHTDRRHSIDGLNFTFPPFADEETLLPPPQGFPQLCAEDTGLFASSYRTLQINIFSSQRGLLAFRAAAVHLSDSRNSTDTTILETTAFRNQTFVNDVTAMPLSKIGRRK